MLIDHAPQADPVVDRAAAALRDAAVPEGPPAAVVAAVRQSGTGVALRERHPIRRRAVLVGLAAAAAVVLASGLLPSLQSARRSARSFASRGDVAFGDVIAELGKVRTVKYRQVTRDHSGVESVSLETVAMDGRYSRSEMLGTDGRIRNWAIYNAGRMLNVDPEGKSASLTDYTTDDGLPHTLADQHTLADLLKMDPKTAKSLGNRDIDGKRLTGFRVNRDYGPRMLRSVDVWIDPKSRLPARVEQTIAYDAVQLSPEEIEKLAADNSPSVQQRIVMTEIRFNVPVDESTFSIEPPKGYSYFEVKLDPSK
jgi:hypothetical protein